MEPFAATKGEKGEPLQDDDIDLTKEGTTIASRKMHAYLLSPLHYMREFWNQWMENRRKKEREAQQALHERIQGYIRDLEELKEAAERLEESVEGRNEAVAALKRRERQNKQREAEQAVREDIQRFIRDCERLKEVLVRVGDSVERFEEAAAAIKESVEILKESEQRLHAAWARHDRVVVSVVVDLF